MFYVQNWHRSQHNHQPAVRILPDKISARTEGLPSLLSPPRDPKHKSIWTTKHLQRELVHSFAQRTDKDLLVVTILSCPISSCLSEMVGLGYGC